MGTRIYALTDSHQEARNLAGILSGIEGFEKTMNTPFLVLDCGDLFKGIYDKDLCVNTYIKFKKQNPLANIIITIGNNDFGFDIKNFEYYKSVVKKLGHAGIDVVCGNLVPSDICQKYKIININNSKILVTGFCLPTSVTKNFGYEFKNSYEALKNIKENLKENYDKLIVLNHHWYPYSKELKEISEKNGMTIDLIIGGHEHSPIQPDFENNIFYPLAFAKSLYTMELDNKIKNIKEYPVDKFKVSPQLEAPIIKYENETNLHTPIAKRVLNLVKRYSEPCALGTFISDNMKKIAKTQIAFHSTGFTMYHLKTEESNVITNYDFKRVICASTPIVKIEISTVELKKVFENATLKRMYKNNGNSRFLQCSGNIKITGLGDEISKSYQIIQIEIDGEELLDSQGKPIDPNRKFSCAIDAFIASGEQGFDLLKNLKQVPVLDAEGNKIQLNNLLFNSLKQAQSEYPPNTQYPAFKIIDL
ncbi:5'-nucleotidase C-terminal domain-containing protein [bacterium]|nr:5'-nucleotidase C-terminal domain-containing protein [bacterium]